MPSESMAINRTGCASLPPIVMPGLIPPHYLQLQEHHLDALSLSYWTCPILPNLPPQLDHFPFLPQLHPGLLPGPCPPLQPQAPLHLSVFLVSKPPPASFS